MAFTIPNEADAFHADQAEPDKVDIDVLVAGMGGAGVISGCAVTAQGSPDMTCAVASGYIRNAAGTAAAVSAGNVTITTAHATLPRIDLVVVNSSGTKSVTAGTAATNPVMPAIPATSVVLAAVYVPAADTTIASNQITDKRVILPTPDNGIYNVKLYGALGDGATDDVTAIHAARDAAGTSGTVLFPPGTYLTSALSANVAGQYWWVMRGATIKLKNSQNTNLLTVSAADVTIAGSGTIDQNKANQTDGVGVYLNGGDRATVLGVHVTNTKGLAAIALNTTNGSRIERVRITSADQHGIFGFDNALNTLVMGCRITGGPSTGGNHGISFHSTTSGKNVSGTHVINNYIEVGAADGFGIEIGSFSGDRPKDCLVEGNTIVVTAQCDGGISFAGMDQSTMANNIFDGAGLTVDNCAYELAIANECIVANNLARGCDAARIGISVDQANRCVVTDNFVRGWANTTAGMHIASSTASSDACDNVISGNVLVAITGNTVPAIHVQANASGVNVDRNSIVGNVMVGVSSATGIKLEINTGTIDATIIVGNSFNAWTTKIDTGTATNTVSANNN